MRLLCALLEWAGTASLKVAGVVDTASRLLPQDVQALVIDVFQVPVPQLSGLRLLGKAVRGSHEDHLAPGATP